MVELFVWLLEKFDLLVFSYVICVLSIVCIFVYYLDYLMEWMWLSEQIYEVGVGMLMDYIVWLLDSVCNVVMFGYNLGFIDLVNLLIDEELKNIFICGIVMIELLVEQWCQILEFSLVVGVWLGCMVYFNSFKQVDQQVEC